MGGREREGKKKNPLVSMPFKYLGVSKSSGNGTVIPYNKL